MKAQPWQERRHEYLEESGKLKSKVIVMPRREQKSDREPISVPRRTGVAALGDFPSSSGGAA